MGSLVETMAEGNKNQMYIVQKCSSFALIFIVTP